MHREAQLAEVEALEIDEVLLERVVDRAEAGHAHIAGKLDIGILVFRRRERELARSLRLATTYGHVGRSGYVRLQLAQVQAVEFDIERGSKGIRDDRAGGLQ